LKCFMFYCSFSLEGRLPIPRAHLQRKDAAGPAMSVLLSLSLEPLDASGPGASFETARTT
jgi:hypothetical protein